MTANLLTLNLSKTEFLLIRLKQQLSKIPYTTPLSLQHTLLVTLALFLTNTLPSQTKSLHFSKSCYYHIPELCCIRPYLNFETASTIATTIVHLNSIIVTFFITTFQKNYQLNRLQQIKISLARAVVKALKSSHITPILKSLHWLKVNERVEYKLLSLT